jgi:hypothetical protein
MLRQWLTNPPRGSVNLQPDINTTPRAFQTSFFGVMFLAREKSLPF